MTYNFSEDVLRLNQDKLGDLKTQPASKSKLPKPTENDVKKAIKDYLAYRGIFNYPLLQGLT